MTNFSKLFSGGQSNSMYYAMVYPTYMLKFLEFCCCAPVVRWKPHPCGKQQYFPFSGSLSPGIRSVCNMLSPHFDQYLN